MAESDPAGNNVSPASQAPVVPAASAPSQRPTVPEPAQQAPPSANEPPPAMPGVRLDDVPKPYAARRPWPAATWIMIAIVSLIVMVLLFLGIRPRRQASQGSAGVEAAINQENVDLSNYNEFVAKNKALIQQTYSEMILTAEPFAGQAPLAVRDSGPLVSAAADPQLAALVDAFCIRVQVMQGSQALDRDRSLSRVTRGEVRGFRVQALEKIDNGKIVAEEAQITTPRNGLVKTVGGVLATLQKTDLQGVLGELRAAGMEFSPLPAAGGEKVFRGQLRFIAPWGKALPGELLIAGDGVGDLNLGTPVNRMRSRLPAAYNILKRRVLVKDAYHEVYKVTDQGGEPLFYVYERDNRVWGIAIISEVFKTAQGMGIQNTLDQMRLHYPQVKLAYSGKRNPFVRVDGVEGIFILQGEDDKKVISILIGESPEFE